MIQLDRPKIFALTVAAGFLLPGFIPNVGLDYAYFFIIVVVLFAWFLIKWDSVKAISRRSNKLEMALGLGAIGAIYTYKIYKASSVGILDLIIIFLGAAVFTFGLRSLKKFWVPAAYGIVLLAGYQIEAYTPNYVALQDWLAGVMAASMRALGISASLQGHLVIMNIVNGSPIILDVSSECTGLQGILAFGLLSTMTLLDFKPKLSRIVPIFAAGFLGAFLINVVRLIVVFLTFEYLGIDAGNTMHVYFGYLIFIAWVLAFWTIAFKYLVPARPLPKAPGITPIVKL
ncbi:MAG TPA: archaeosortase/exosortase family protein [Nitrososphaerales archaeon]|nr:archaeosortase/exosortase family protein [Nitrososphaerales archaeon]